MKAILRMPFSVTTFFLTEANHVSSTVLKKSKGSFQLVIHVVQRVHII